MVTWNAVRHFEPDAPWPDRKGAYNFSRIPVLRSRSPIRVHRSFRLSRKRFAETALAYAWRGNWKGKRFRTVGRRGRESKKTGNRAAGGAKGRPDPGGTCAFSAQAAAGESVESEMGCWRSQFWRVRERHGGHPSSRNPCAPDAGSLLAFSFARQRQEGEGVEAPIWPAGTDGRKEVSARISPVATDPH